MRLTKLFTKTSKTAPADETSKNAQLLIQAGFIHKEMAGVYTFLPLGKIVLDKIIQIIREEMNAVGGSELSMTALQSKELWEKTGRWSDDVFDVWFKTKLASGGEAGLAPTHEEPLTRIMKSFISSYKDLPAYPYQFQIKFRNELRAKSGLMRGKEFWMKDLYSFSRNSEEHDKFYEEITAAYNRVYDRLGIGDITYKTFASGGSFSQFSHEFQTLSDVGEDTIYVHEGKKIAINEEVYNDKVLAELGVSRNELVEKQAVEVGNIFTLGTRFSEPLNLTYTAEDGTVHTVHMGCYGIGPSRLVGLIAEHFADDKGLVWPSTVAPALVYLVQIGNDDAINKKAEETYETFQNRGIEVIYDDRDLRPGEKFGDADLLGIPYRVVVGKKTLENDLYEVKDRQTGEITDVSLDDLLKLFVPDGGGI